MRVDIPVLRSERLILRAPVAADFADYAAVMASPRAVGMGGPVRDERMVWGMFCHCVALWALSSPTYYPL